MYTVYANNHFGNVKFEESYLEWSLALNVYNVACKCADCKDAMIIDALTGEVLKDWDYTQRR